VAQQFLAKVCGRNGNQSSSDPPRERRTVIPKTWGRSTWTAAYSHIATAQVVHLKLQGTKNDISVSTIDAAESSNCLTFLKATAHY